MKFRIFFLILYHALYSIPLFCGGLSEEIYTSFKAGPGYEVEGNVSFLVSYRLYRAPRGIRRFPDGGQSRTEFSGTYVIILDKGLPKGFLELKGVAADHNRIADNSKKILAPRGVLREDFDMNVTNRIIRQTGPGAIGLPSPLNFCGKPEREYLMDVVHLKGDYQYRKEIIRNFVSGSPEARAILEKMDDYEAAMEGYKKMEYRIYSEDTRKDLENLIISGEKS